MVKSMGKSTRSYEERILELERKEQETIEKSKKYSAQAKELRRKKAAEERQKRTHRLCQIGGAVESVLGRAIEPEELPKLINFLNQQETNGKYFSRAMQREWFPEAEPEKIGDSLIL
jgi:hypothetical protein